MIKQSLNEAKAVLENVLEDEDLLGKLDQTISVFSKVLTSGGRILACGNGGSYCDAQHFTEELTGRFSVDRKPLSAMCLGDPAHITCVSNDFGADYIFSRLVQAWGRKNDALLCISTSGNSKNVVEAALEAKREGLIVVGLLGKDGGKLRDLVDIPLIIPSDVTHRIQEIHIKFIHTIIQGIEKNLFSADSSPV